MRRDEMRDLVREAVSEAIKQIRPGVISAAPKKKSDKDKILSCVDNAATALADGDDDEALDILNGLLEEYEG